MSSITSSIPAAADAERKSPPAAIELSALGVRYVMPAERILSFKEYILRRLRGRLDFRELWALDAVDLQVQRGETLGIVGRNGAGKSTLLKVISRVLPPTTGRVVVRGRVAPLLELGAGFHFDLTGRENVFLNATLLGYSRSQIESGFEEIIEFSELRDFIDQPVRNYSSGMLARLGFAVATQFRPQILILDEILAVGDPGFQHKCLERLNDFQSAGTTILFVSHAVGEVASFCHRVAWLDYGKLMMIGPSAEVLEHYLAALEAST